MLDTGHTNNDHRADQACIDQSDSHLRLGLGSRFKIRAFVLGYFYGSWEQRFLTHLLYPIRSSTKRSIVEKMAQTGGAVFGTPPHRAPVDGREGLAMSMPPGGMAGRVRERGASPRRKLDEVIGSTAMSPTAKRANRYETPAPASGPEMTVAALSAEMYTVKAAMLAMHTWILGIETTVDGHADHLESAAQDVKMITGNLARFERQIIDQNAGAEGKISEVFARVDNIIGELRGEAASGMADLAGKIHVRIEQIEHRLAAAGGAAPASPPGIDASAVALCMQEVDKCVAGIGDMRNRMDSQQSAVELISSALEQFQTNVMANQSRCHPEAWQVAYASVEPHLAASWMK